MQRVVQRVSFSSRVFAEQQTNTQLQEDTNRGARGDGLAGGKERRQQPRGHVGHWEHADTFVHFGVWMSEPSKH